MTRVILDETLRDKLNNLSQPLELCDESGRVVARVFPVMDLSEYEPCEPTISEEELRRMIRDAGFVPKQRDTLYRTYFLN